VDIAAGVKRLGGTFAAASIGVDGAVPWTAPCRGPCRGADPSRRGGSTSRRSFRLFGTISIRMNLETIRSGPSRADPAPTGL